MKLLLCDDHRLFLESLATAVAADGHEVITAAHPAEAVRAVKANDPDVCVLDVRFRSGTGVDAARIVREHFPRTRVLMLSAAVDPDLVTACLELGVSGFVRKDQPVAELLNAIERVGQGHLVADSTLFSGGGGRPHEADSGELRLLRSLTPREREVLQHLIDAHDTRSIAASLNISTSTARSHVQNVLLKLGVHTRLQAVALVARTGFDPTT